MTDLVQKLVGALEGAYALAIGHASTYKFQHGLDEFHPTHQKILDDAQTALSEAKAGGWQPIETAPKDGTEMLLLFGNAEYIFGKTHGRVRAACWTGSGASANWSLPYFKDNPPTAWQPLPAPPAQKDPT